MLLLSRLARWRRVSFCLAVATLALCVGCEARAVGAGCGPQETAADGKRCAFLQARWEAGCSVNWMRAEGQAKALRLSGLLADDLQRLDAQVVLLGRAGSNAPAERFSRRVGEAEEWWDYTHGALAFRPDPMGEWVVVHLLNTCDELSGVFSESLEEFFLDNPWEYRAIVAVPTPQLQTALLEVIVNRQLAASFYDHSVYSSISYPYSLERQNSTEYVLDVLVGALAYSEGVDGVSDRSAAKEYFLSSYAAQFQPEAITAGLLERIGIRLGFGPSNVTLTDHRADTDGNSGEYQFVSVGSLIQFLDTVGALAQTIPYALPDVQRASDTVELEQ